MPELPSGKQIALDPSPIYSVIEEAYKGIKVNELIMIERQEHLFRYIKVMYFRLQEEHEVRSEKYFKFSIVPPAGMMPYDSGFNLLTIELELEKWEYCDQKALVEFLKSKRIDRFFEEVISTVREAQLVLLEQPASLQGLLATWWKHGCHPLQDELE